MLSTPVSSVLGALPSGTHCASILCWLHSMSPALGTHPHLPDWDSLALAASPYLGPAPGGGQARASLCREARRVYHPYFMLSWTLQRNAMADTHRGALTCDATGAPVDPCGGCISDTDTIRTRETGPAELP